MLFVLAVQRAGAAKTAVLSSTAPLFALPLAALLLGERLTGRVILGTLLSIAGVWLVVAPG
jgi:drug/metabolite transporter (DMT)-like permease